MSWPKAWRLALTIHGLELDQRLNVLPICNRLNLVATPPLLTAFARGNGYGAGVDEGFVLGGIMIPATTVEL